MLHFHSAIEVVNIISQFLAFVNDSPSFRGFVQYLKLRRRCRIDKFLVNIDERVLFDGECET